MSTQPRLRQARFRWIVAVLGIAIALLAVVSPDQALSQGQGSHDSGKDFDTLKAAGNENPAGIWSNKTTMWVVDPTDGKLYAYALATRTRDSAKDIALHDSNDSPTSVWSDGTTIWVANTSDNKLYAYTLVSGAYDYTKTVLGLGNVEFVPRGIWSNGTTLWVSFSGQNKLFAYAGLGPARDNTKDIALAAANGDALEIWSDRTTMWVLDSADKKLYAYDLASRSRSSSKDIDLDASSSGQTQFAGLWADGTTWWATDPGSDKIFAYRFTAAADLMPSFGGQAIAAKTYTQNRVVDDTLPTATGGDGELSYSLEGRLPPGLSFSSTTRKITGIPTGTQAATDYTYLATDADGDKASLSFSITVERAAGSSTPDSGGGDASLLLDLSLFHQCCIYEERGRQQFSMRVDLAQEQTERVQVNVSYDLGETADDFESFHVQAFGITAGTKSAGIIVTATPRDDDVEEPEKYLTVTASATIGGATHSDTQVLKLIDNDAPEPAMAVPLAVSAEGLVTWNRKKKRGRGQIYLLRWVGGESPPSSAADAPDHMKRWIEGRDCGKDGCEFRIADFDPGLHYLVQVRSIPGKAEWEEIRHTPALSTAAPPADEPEETPVPQTGPGLVISTVADDPRALDVSWNPLGDTFHYRVRATPNGFFETIAMASGVLEARLTGLETGTTYAVTVEAFTDGGIIVYAEGQGTPGAERAARPSAAPAAAQDDYKSGQDLIDDVWDYARETQQGYDHVLRWMRVLKTLGAITDMTSSEAQGYADGGWERWDPVAVELKKLEDAPGGYEPDQAVVANVRSYAQETEQGFDHVLRWMRVLKTFDAITDMTSSEAQGYADRGWERWDPVVEELKD